MPDGTFNGTSCRPLEKFAEYRVAVNDYIAQGGSGFSVLKRNTTKFNTGISLRDALVDYIRTLPSHKQNANVCDPTQNTNIIGIRCKDSRGETFDCTTSCSCPDGTTNCAQYTQCAGQVVQCVTSSGAAYDCTKDCCCHDQFSGANRCGTQCSQYLGCQGLNLQPSIQYLSPEPYDYTNIACLDQVVQSHDGRIQTYGAGGGNTGGSM